MAMITVLKSAYSLQVEVTVLLNINSYDYENYI